MFKILPNGNKKYCHSCNTLKDADLKAYKKWCQLMDMDWQVIDADTHEVVEEQIRLPKRTSEPIQVNNHGASEWYRKGRYMGD